MFEYLIVVSPLGLLYGSSGPFLSPENLVGRSGNSFPPSSATLSGLYAAKYSDRDRQLHLPNLRIAGPFWAYQENPENFYVPTPFTYLAKMDAPKQKGEIRKGRITERLHWQPTEKQWHPNVTGKFDSRTWIAIEQWHNPQEVSSVPWQYLPHLHPRLEQDERKVDQQNEQGSLFLENAIQMHPDTCLIYLANTPLEDGWYRFGGEGHFVDVKSQKITKSTVLELLNQPVDKHFASIAPAIWGSQHLSYREPKIYQNNQWSSVWQLETFITERPTPFRYRLGGQGKTKRLSRGRYAVPAGTVYVLKEAIPKPWHQWEETWFPKEAYSFQRWGSGLALPLSVISNQLSVIK